MPCATVKEAGAKLFPSGESKGGSCKVPPPPVRKYGCPEVFLFQSEKSVAQRKKITFLKLPGARVSSIPKWDETSCSRFLLCSLWCWTLKNVVQKGASERASSAHSGRESHLGLDWQMLSIRWQQDREPGILGLSSDFLKWFWSTIGSNLHAMFLECLRTQSLPVSTYYFSWRKGDLALLKKWRPLAVFCTDYKVLTWASSNRTKPFIFVIWLS